MFFPQPQDPITKYGCVEGQTGYIAINFTSNPLTTRVWWTLEYEGKIDVPTELAHFSAPNHPSNYEAHPLKPVNSLKLKLKLKLKVLSLACRLGWSLLVPVLVLSTV